MAMCACSHIRLIHCCMLQMDDSDASAHSPDPLPQLRKQLGEAQQQANRLWKLQQQSAIPRLDLVGLTHTLFYLVPGIQLSAHLVLATVLVQVQHAAVGMQLEAFQNRL